MAYTKQTWADLSAGGTPLSADRLNHIETGIETVETSLYSKMIHSVTYSVTGALVTGTGTIQWPAPRALTLVNVAVRVRVSPTGASAIFDVNKNGTTIFTTQANRPTVAASGNSDMSSVPDVTALASGDYITVDVDQIGSTIAGTDATIIIEYRVV